MVTHRPPPPAPHGPVDFVFVEGVREAVERARESAGDRYTTIGGGADIARQALAAGLVDEMQLHDVPVLLGDGVPLFRPDPDRLAADQDELVEAPGVTHLRYRVEGDPRPASHPATPPAPPPHEWGERRRGARWTASGRSSCSQWRCRRRPGPDDVLVLSSSLRGGPRLGAATAFGAATGALLWGAAAAVGLAAVVTRSQTAYDTLRVAGAGYLVVLGAAPLLAQLLRRGRVAARRPPHRPAPGCVRRSPRAC